MNKFKNFIRGFAFASFLFLAAVMFLVNSVSSDENQTETQAETQAKPEEQTQSQHISVESNKNAPLTEAQVLAQVHPMGITLEEFQHRYNEFVIDASLKIKFLNITNIYSPDWEPGLSEFSTCEKSSICVKGTFITKTGELTWLLLRGNPSNDLEIPTAFSHIMIGSAAALPTAKSYKDVIPKIMPLLDQKAPFEGTVKLDGINFVFERDKFGDNVMNIKKDY